MYYDVPGRPRHPFETVNSFVASPLADSIAGSVVTYKFSPSFTINKSPLAITSLQVDFNDGNGLRSVSLNSNVAVTYTIPGYKYLKFIAGFSNSTTVTTYAFIKITQAPAQISGLSCDQHTLGFPQGDPGQAFRKIALIDGSLGVQKLIQPVRKVLPSTYEEEKRLFSLYAGGPLQFLLLKCILPPALTRPVQSSI